MNKRVSATLCKAIIICLILPSQNKKINQSVCGDIAICAISIGTKKVLYTNLLTSGKLNSYLADLDKQAENMFYRLVKQMAERESITEQLKADNQMEGVARMNNIRSRATEIVNNDIIYN